MTIEEPLTSIAAGERNPAMWSISTILNHQRYDFMICIMHESTERNVLSKTSLLLSQILQYGTLLYHT